MSSEIIKLMVFLSTPNSTAYILAAKTRPCSYQFSKVVRDLIEVAGGQGAGRRGNNRKEFE
jgi:protein involved in polysaccharide export with SLBB domain